LFSLKTKGQLIQTPALEGGGEGSKCPFWGSKFPIFQTYLKLVGSLAYSWSSGFEGLKNICSPQPSASDIAKISQFNNGIGEDMECLV
jgi:hypothetical protein